MPLRIVMPFDCRYAARLGCTVITLALLAVDGSAAGVRKGVHRGSAAGHAHTASKKPIMRPVELPEEGILSSMVPDEGPRYELKLARPGEETIDVTYRVGDTYVPEALDKLNDYLRDSHNDEVKTYDPRTFDVLYTILAKLDQTSSVIEVLSGYRTQETNDELRRMGTTNAAKHSQHIEATALDIRVPGVSAALLRDAALAVGAGGVGYYPKGQFIHVDTGRVRKWTFAGRHGKRNHRHRRK